MRLLSLISRIAQAKLRLLVVRLRLAASGGRRSIIAFDLPSAGEWQFLEPVLRRYVEKNPRDQIVIVHHGATVSFVNKEMPLLAKKFLHLDNAVLRTVLFQELDMFLTTEQYRLGMDGVYSVALFHGQPSKGLTFTRKIINGFDAFFLYGDLQALAYEEFVRDNFTDRPRHVELFKVGYPKSDALLQGAYSREQILAELRLSPEKKTILYAPAFNEYASLRESGIEIIDCLAHNTAWNVLVKLPIECWEPTDNFYASGGRNWFEEIKKMEAQYANLRLFAEYKIDALLACADVLVTCVSSVSFEFFALNKPVVFVETHRFFSKYLQTYFPGKDTQSWASRTTVNGGKEFGLVVEDFAALTTAIETVLASPAAFPLQQARLKSFLLYNPGQAADAAVATIEKLLAQGAVTSRPAATRGFFRTCLTGVLALLSRIPRFFGQQMRRVFFRFLHGRGFRIEKTGGAYHDPDKLVQAAEHAGMSLCEYLESQETDTRKHGRRDRIIAQMDRLHLFDSCSAVVEIGAGTGMYMEKVVEKARPERYEVYETHPGWCSYLTKSYKDASCQVVVHASDGETLQGTKDASCRLVHAHAVFVYIPVLKIFSYLREAVRVLAPGGYLVFDCLLDSGFGPGEVQKWLDSRWRFPVLVPEKLLFDFLEQEGVSLVHRFQEIYGESSVDYLLLRKK